MSSMTQNKKEAVIFSYSLILDKEGKFITEIKSMPVDDKEIMDKAFAGVIITPLDTHLMSAIVGLYFGGSLVKK